MQLRKAKARQLGLVLTGGALMEIFSLIFDVQPSLETLAAFVLALIICSVIAVKGVD